MDSPFATPAKKSSKKRVTFAVAALNLDLMENTAMSTSAGVWDPPFCSTPASKQKTKVGKKETPEDD